MSVGITISDTIVSAVSAGVAVYNEFLGDPAHDPAIIGNPRTDMKRTRRRVPQSLVRRIANTVPMKPDPRIKIPVSIWGLLHVRGVVKESSVLLRNVANNLCKC